MKKLIKIALFSLLGFFVIIQFFPIDHSNAPVIREPSWDSPKTREFAERACFDCHSNRVKYPWYSYIAPVSWMLRIHIKEGNAELNFSEWTGNEDGAEIIKTIQKGKMPLWEYKLMHPEARLTKAEQESLIAGLKRTIDQGKLK
jgi:cytochrome c551/c552